ncbi:MAG: hypothetical protein LBR53_10355 [Deltaproteobacteria bacterium]|jgi:pentatricopeptide repeat protein|nr:hypothetical protein [Deltaproteobacteria bacterium]
MKAQELFKLEEKFYFLLDQSQDPELARTALLEAASDLKKSRGGDGGAETGGGARGGEKSATKFENLVSRLLEAPAEEIPYLDELVLSMNDALDGGESPRPPVTKWGEKTMRRRNGTDPPPYIGKSGKLKNIYSSPIGLLIRERQRGVIRKALGVYRKMRALMEKKDRSDPSREASPLPAAAGIGLETIVALAGVRLSYFFLFSDNFDLLEDFLLELRPFSAGETSSTEQALIWNKIVRCLAKSGDFELALLALEKIKEITPYPGVLRAFSGGARELIRHLAEEERSLRTPWEALSRGRQVYRDLRESAPSVHQYEKPGVIPFIPVERVMTEEWFVFKVGFLDGVRNFWTRYEDKRFDLDDGGALWPFRRKNAVLDYHYDMCVAATLLCSPPSFPDDLEEVEDVYLKMINLIDYYATNPYRLKCAAELSVLYARYRKFEKAKFIHQIMLSVKSRDDSGGSGEFEEEREEEEEGGRFDVYDEALLFDKIKSEATMRLMDVFIEERRHEGAANQDSNRPGGKLGGAEEEKNFQRDSFYGPADFPDAFDRLYDKNERLEQIEALLDSGDIPRAAGLFFASDPVSVNDAARFLHAGAAIFFRMSEKQIHRYGKKLLKRVFEVPTPHARLRNYAAHSLMKILRSIDPIRNSECAESIYARIIQLTRPRSGERSRRYFSGIEQILKDARKYLASMNFHTLG